MSLKRVGVWCEPMRHCAIAAASALPLKWGGGLHRYMLFEWVAHKNAIKQGGTAKERLFVLGD